MVSTSGNRSLLRGRSSAYTWEIVRHYQPTSPSASCTILWHLPGEIIHGYRVRVDHQLLHGGNRSSLQGQGRSSASPWGDCSSLQGQGRSSASTQGNHSSLQGQGRSSASTWGVVHHYRVRVDHQLLHGGIVHHHRVRVNHQLLRRGIVHHYRVGVNHQLLHGGNRSSLPWES